MNPHELFDGRYRIIRIIGSGGMGQVYEAEDQSLKKSVALKMLGRGILSAENIIRFQREATALSSLNHPNIVPLFIFGITDENEPYMVMGLEQGITLSQLIKQRGTLPLYKSLGIFLQLCDAMQHAHSHGVLHRDLKPSNILIKNAESEKPHPVIIDFGIALLDNDNKFDSLTKKGIILGTPAYMSPEQIRGSMVDERADVYALGCIMYEMLTGTQPFTGDSALEIISLKTNGSAPSINDAAPWLKFPKGIENIIAISLERSPEDRYSSMEALKQDILQFKSGDYDATEPTQEPIPKGAQAKPQYKEKAVLAACLLTIALIGATLAIVSGNLDFRDKPLEKQVNPPKISAPETAQDIKISERGNEISIASGISNAQAISKVLEKKRSYIDLDLVEARDLTPNFFSQCQNLMVTKLRSVNSGFNDTTLEAISHIPAMVDLALLDEYDISGKGLTSLAKLSHLRLLSLTNCNMSDEKVDGMCKLKQLTFLRLENSVEINDRALIRICDNLKDLKTLYLSRTGVTTAGLKHLGKIKDLNELALQDVNLHDDDLRILGQLHDLKQLNVRDNDGLTDKGLSFLSDLKNLQELSCDSPKMTKKAMASLKEKIGPELRFEGGGTNWLKQIRQAGADVTPPNSWSELDH